MIKKIFLILIICVVFSNGCYAYEYVDVEYLYGNDRYDTNIDVNKKFKSDKAVLCTGNSYGDALSASYLCQSLDCPLLLVDKNSQNKIIDHIKSENVKNVYIIGGELSVPKSIESSLKNCKFKRYWGTNSITTNMEVLKSKEIKPYSELFVCTSTDYADALSISPVGKPILLVNNKLTEEQIQFIKSKKITRFYVIGGESAVSKDVEHTLKNIGYTERIAGNNRYNTCLAVYNKFFKDSDKIVLTVGTNFPDALSSSYLAYKNQAPILLYNESVIKPTIDKSNVTRLFVIGGGIKKSNIDNLLNKPQQPKKYKLYPLIEDLNKKEKEIAESIIKKARETQQQTLKAGWIYTLQQIYKGISEEKLRKIVNAIQNTYLPYSNYLSNAKSNPVEPTRTNFGKDKYGNIGINYYNLREDMEREKFVNSWVVDASIKCMNYDRMTTFNNIYNYVSSYFDYEFFHNKIFRSLTSKKANCQVYSLAFYDIATELGFDCIMLSSLNPDGSGHVFNMIKLNNKWYFTDPTWSGCEEFRLSTTLWKDESHTYPITKLYKGWVQIDKISN